jgi:hypothetical protein
MTAFCTETVERIVMIPSILYRPLEMRISGYPTGINRVRLFSIKCVYSWYSSPRIKVTVPYNLRLTRVDLFFIFIVIQVLICGMVVAATASYVAKKN